MKSNFFTYLILLIFTVNISKSQEIYTKNIVLMGSDFEITIVEKNESNANKLINIAINEISRIESLISSWNKNSQTSLINHNAGIKPVKVDKELFELILRSIKISNLSQGAFDISYASLDKVWYFDKKMTEIPTDLQIKKSVSKVGFKLAVLVHNELDISGFSLIIIM